MRAFSVGVLRFQWILSSAPRTVPGGEMWDIQLTEIDTARGGMRRERVHDSLVGVVVSLPDGTVRRIVDVDSRATLGLVPGATLSVLLQLLEA